MSVKIKRQNVPEHNKSAQHRPFKCEVCNTSFKYMATLNKHLYTHVVKKAHKCTICNRYFLQLNELRIHLKFHERTSTYKCTICDKILDNANIHRTHMLAHAEQRRYECKRQQTKILSSADNQEHDSQASEENSLTCQICNSVCNLKQHLRSHTDPKPQHICTICSRPFTHAGDMRRHLQIHNDEKPYYRCEICDKHFTWSSTLSYHLRTHTGEKIHRCEICDKQFPRSSSLKNHLRTHTGEKPYGCKICNQQFVWPSGLKRHVCTHTGEQPRTNNAVNLHESDSCNIKSVAEQDNCSVDQRSKVECEPAVECACPEQLGVDMECHTEIVKMKELTHDELIVKKEVVNSYDKQQDICSADLIIKAECQPDEDCANIDSKQLCVDKQYHRVIDISADHLQDCSVKFEHFTHDELILKEELLSSDDE